MPEAIDKPVRKIIHIDMDAFFASVEQRDNPQLRGKPVAVGGSAQRGVVAAASYEARKFGVRSAMPSVTAARRCPGLVFVPPRFDVYRAVSQQIRQIFALHSDLVEPLSLDEAYLDVTRDKQRIGSATRIAQLIRAAIRDRTGLTASAGVSYNKFLAKVASDQNKPDGICVIRPHQGADFVASLPVRRFYGVGPKTAERMGRLGIEAGADLRDRDMDFLREHFGKSADYLYLAASTTARCGRIAYGNPWAASALTARTWRRSRHCATPWRASSTRPGSGYRTTAPAVVRLRSKSNMRISAR